MVGPTLDLCLVEIAIRSHPTLTPTLPATVGTDISSPSDAKEYDYLQITTLHYPKRVTTQPNTNTLLHLLLNMKVSMYW